MMARSTAPQTKSASRARGRSRPIRVLIPSAQRGAVPTLHMRAFHHHVELSAGAARCVGYTQEQHASPHRTTPPPHHRHTTATPQRARRTHHTCLLARSHTHTAVLRATVVHS